MKTFKEWDDKTIQDAIGKGINLGSVNALRSFFRSKDESLSQSKSTPQQKDDEHKIWATARIRKEFNSQLDDLPSGKREYLANHCVELVERFMEEIPTEEKKKVYRREKKKGQIKSAAA